MLRLRPYKPCDAEKILDWCRDEREFRLWTSDRYDSYPISAEDMNHKYIHLNGDCPDPENFFPLTAFDESGAVGHLILRFTDEEKKVLRIGFVILDSTKRGKGLGSEMIRLALKYSFEILGAEKVTIGVFDSNPAACYCYKAAGFTESAEQPRFQYSYDGENWSVIELELNR